MLDQYLKDPDFLDKTRDIRKSTYFLKLKEAQHHNDSVYNHTLRVAYTAFKLGRRYRVNIDALLRGALFHDLYFHDWRDKNHLFNHGWTHPYIALENAKKYFSPISELEANIISSHMWPFNFKNPPRSKEALIVALSDKMVATTEVVIMFYNFVTRPLRKNKSQKPDI
ncbi:hypothetical protein MASR2M29_22400 [Spirochaetota bacterium]